MIIFEENRLILKRCKGVTHLQRKRQTSFKRSEWKNFLPQAGTPSSSFPLIPSLWSTNRQKWYNNFWKSFCFTTSQSSREAAFSTTTASAPLLLILLLSKNRTRLLSSSEKWLLAANSMLNLSGRRDHQGPSQVSAYNSKKDPSWQPSKRAHQNSYRRRNVGALLTSSGPPFSLEKSEPP